MNRDDPMIDRLIAELERLAGRQQDGSYRTEISSEGRAALARLRRGLGRAPGECGEMLPHVVPFLPKGDDEERIRPFFLVASLFAYHPPTDNRPGLSIGAAMRAVFQERQIDSIEKRFVALLNAHSDELPHHLRQVIGLLGAQQDATPLDYRQLLRDLERWNRPDRRIQMQWARDFWGHKPEPNAAPGAVETAADTPDAD